MVTSSPSSSSDDSVHSSSSSTAQRASSSSPSFEPSSPSKSPSSSEVSSGDPTSGSGPKSSSAHHELFDMPSPKGIDSQIPDSDTERVGKGNSPRASNQHHSEESHIADSRRRSKKRKNKDTSKDKRAKKTKSAPDSATEHSDSKISYKVDHQGNPILPKDHKYRIGPVDGPFTYEALKNKIQWKSTKERIHKAMIQFNYYGRADELTDVLCMPYLYTVFECEDREEDNAIQKHINAMFRNKLFTKVHNDGRVWRSAGFLKLDDPDNKTWQWVGGAKAPSYLKPTAPPQNTNTDDGSRALKAALRNYNGSFKNFIRILVRGVNHALGDGSSEDEGHEDSDVDAKNGERGQSAVGNVVQQQASHIGPDGGHEGENGLQQLNPEDDLNMFNLPD